MQRNTIRQLAKWKEKPDRKPLVVTGVRQCGKTYLLQEFGEQYFEDTAYFNFESREDIGAVFEHNFDVDRIVDELGSVILGREIAVGRALVIFDEIQACPRAITALKYFCENMRELHIIAAGSLLGVALKSEDVSFPVGKVDRLSMYPMSFAEFVEADGGGQLLKGMEKRGFEEALPELYTEPMKRYLKLYYIVGGMPEVVQNWITHHDFEQVDEIQKRILNDYADDFSKHAPASEVPKIRLVWESIPKQLARENNKFIFSYVKKSGRAKELENALAWLCDAGLAYKLELVEHPVVPLSFEADASYFKVYMSDVGLLRCRSGIYFKTILDGEESFSRFKGAFAENFVINELCIQDLPTWFWRSGNQAEVDVLTEYHSEMVPIEVKSADNTQAKSFRVFIKRYRPKWGFKTSLKNIAVNQFEDTDVYSLPLYLVHQLREILAGF